jgi:hypothetical protein
LEFVNEIILQGKVQAVNSDKMNINSFILETHGSDDSFLEHFEALRKSVEDEHVTNGGGFMLNVWDIGEESNYFGVKMFYEVADADE